MLNIWAALGFREQAVSAAGKQSGGEDDETCNIPEEILNYIHLVEADTPRACKEQHALVAHIRKCFATEDIDVNTEQLAKKYLGLVRYFPLSDVSDGKNFYSALWDCTYKENGTPRWKTLLCMVGRGAGKDGFIAFDSACSISPYNPIAHYNVEIFVRIMR